MKFNTKTYGEDVKYKRKSQKFLFKELPSPHVFVGLGGTHATVYKELISSLLNPSKIILCDLNPKTENVLHIDLLTAVKTYNPTFIDCDFCRTVLTDGKIFLDCLQYLKDNNKHWGISFTFSTRAHGLGMKKTIDWLDTNVFENTLQYSKITSESEIPFVNGKKGWPKYIKYYSVTSKYNVRLTQYCDSSNIISGVIWK